MKSNKRLVGIFAALLLGLIVADSANAAWVNGWWVYPYRYFMRDSFYSRPFAASQKSLVVQDLVVQNTPINHPGIALGATRVAPYYNWAYRNILVKHVQVSGIWRTGGYHQDFIHVTGGGNWQDVPTTLTIQDADLHDGVGIPVNIQDGWFDKITLKDIRVRNTTVCLQITTINTGKVGTVLIDHCPNLSIAIMGRPGSIGTVYVKNSPGIRVGDTLTKNGKSGARIIHLD